MAKEYPLVVTQDAIEGHPTRTEHWSFVVMLSSSPQVCEIHELRGNYDTFTYVHERRKDWQKSLSLRGGCHVGYVPENALSQLPEILRKVEIIKHTQEFDCQNWVVDALKALKEKGLVFKEMNEKVLRRELAEDYDRSETGHDVIYEILQV